MPKCNSDKLPTHKELTELLDYNPLTGIFTWKVYRNDKIRPGAIAGTPTPKGYIRICINSKQHMAHRLAWFYVYKEWPDDQLDHRDTVKHHNWIKNLRQANNIQNSIHKGLRSDNTSGYKGVTFNTSECKWKVRCNVDKVRYNLGTFANKKGAISAYEAFAKQHHAEFYRPQ